MTSVSGATVLSVSKLSKKYCRHLKRSFWYGAQDIVRELTGRRSSKVRESEFWAVRNVSFDLEPGQSLGLIGSNGCGKTTLLKLLSGLIKPNEGEVRIRGRVAPLLALGAGFNPVLSGRENIHVNLALLGLSRKQINERLNEIVDFAEVWDAIDAPLRTYSSGMSARLGFSCAIHTDPDILFVDEVLAVGDARFRTKCYQRLAALRAKGAALILVSHSHNAIVSSCERGLYLNKGRVMFLGPAEEALKVYEVDQQKIDEATPSPGHGLLPQSIERKDFVISRAGFVDGNGNPVASIHSGEPSYFQIRFCGRLPVEKMSATVIIRDLKMMDYLSLNSAVDGKFFQFAGGEGSLTLRFPRCGIKPGKYTAKISLVSGDLYHVLDMVEGYLFECRSDSFLGHSMYYQPHDWDYSGASAAIALSEQNS